MPYPKEKKAILSSCGKYRYTLWRTDINTAHTQDGYVLFICLNPSTATDLSHDRTSKNCMALAHKWGYNEFCITNLYALYATDPKEMFANKDRIEEAGQIGKNDTEIINAAKKAALIVVAWGNDGQSYRRDREILTKLQEIKLELFCLNINSTGAPLHPSRISIEEYPEPTEYPYPKFLG